MRTNARALKIQRSHSALNPDSIMMPDIPWNYILWHSVRVRVSVLHQLQFKAAFVQTCCTKSHLNNNIRSIQNSMFIPIVGRGPPRSSKGTCENIFGSRKGLTNYENERLMRNSVLYAYLIAGLKMHYTTNAAPAGSSRNNKLEGASGMAERCTYVHTRVVSRLRRTVTQKLRVTARQVDSCCSRRLIRPCAPKGDAQVRFPWQLTGIYYLSSYASSPLMCSWNSEKLTRSGLCALVGRACPL